MFFVTVSLDIDVYIYLSYVDKMVNNLAQLIKACFIQRNVYKELNTRNQLFEM